MKSRFGSAEGDVVLFHIQIDCVITKTKVRGEVNWTQREGKDTKDRIEDTEQKKEIEIVLNTEKLVEN